MYFVNRMSYSMHSIYVINLARRPERWQKWTEEAQKWGVNEYTRFEGIDGNSLQMTDEIKYLFRENDFENNPWVMGCALSHFFLWMLQIENQMNQMIIFEDDAQFTERFEIPSLPEGWDLFYFGGTRLPNIYAPGDYVENRIMIPRLKPPQFFSTVCYMLSLQGVQKVISEVNENGLGLNVDRFLMKLHSKMNVFCYAPLPVFADYSYGTDILNKPHSLEEV